MQKSFKYILLILSVILILSACDKQSDSNSSSSKDTITVKIHMNLRIRIIHIVEAKIKQKQLKYQLIRNVQQYQIMARQILCSKWDFKTKQFLLLKDKVLHFAFFPSEFKTVNIQIQAIQEDLIMMNQLNQNLMLSLLHLDKHIRKQQMK